MVDRNMCYAGVWAFADISEDLFTALEEQFQPSDANEQIMANWITLKQTHSVTAHMNEVDSTT